MALYCIASASRSVTDSSQRGPVNQLLKFILVYYESHAIGIVTSLPRVFQERLLESLKDEQEIELVMTSVQVAYSCTLSLCAIIFI
jgi:hypothetical protein